jgi:hypothetical protein
LGAPFDAGLSWRLSLKYLSAISKYLQVKFSQGESLSN